MEKSSSVRGVLEGLKAPLVTPGESMFILLLLGIAAVILSNKGAKD